MKKIKYISIALLLAMMACTGGNTNKEGASATSPQVLPVEEYAKAYQADSTAILIDVRTPEEYAEGHIEGAMLLNVMDEANFIKGIEALPSDLTFYIYCRSGRRSQTASKLMTERGLKVIDLKGGYNAWKTENGK